MANSVDVLLQNFPAVAASPGGSLLEMQNLYPSAQTCSIPDCISAKSPSEVGSSCSLPESFKDADALSLTPQMVMRLVQDLGMGI